jgi:hypothetical protein
VFDGPKNAGTYRLVWDALNDSGQVVASGIYLVLVRSEDWRECKKIVFLK